MLLVLLGLAALSAAYQPPDDNGALYKVALTQNGYIQFLQYDVRIPSLQDFAFCLWLKSENFTNIHPIFSYSKDGTERLIRAWLEPSTDGAWANLAVLEVPVVKARVRSPDRQWMHLCHSWDGAKGLSRLFVDGKVAAQSKVLQLRGAVIPAGGLVVVGQEYTDADKGLDDGVEGEVFGFNMIGRGSTLFRDARSVDEDEDLDWHGDGDEDAFWSAVANGTLDDFFSPAEEIAALAKNNRFHIPSARSDKPKFVSKSSYQTQVPIDIPLYTTEKLPLSDRQFRVNVQTKISGDTGRTDTAYATDGINSHFTTDNKDYVTHSPYSTINAFPSSSGKPRNFDNHRVKYNGEPLDSFTDHELVFRNIEMMKDLRYLPRAPIKEVSETSNYAPVTISPKRGLPVPQVTELVDDLPELSTAGYKYINPVRLRRPPQALQQTRNITAGNKQNSTKFDSPQERVIPKYYQNVVEVPSLLLNVVDTKQNDLEQKDSKLRTGPLTFHSEPGERHLNPKKPENKSADLAPHVAKSVEQYFGEAHRLLLGHPILPKIFANTTMILKNSSEAKSQAPMKLSRTARMQTDPQNDDYYPVNNHIDTPNGNYPKEPLLERRTYATTPVKSQLSAIDAPRKVASYSVTEVIEDDIDPVSYFDPRRRQVAASALPVTRTAYSRYKLLPNFYNRPEKLVSNSTRESESNKTAKPESQGVSGTQKDASSRTKRMTIRWRRTSMRQGTAPTKPRLQSVHLNTPSLRTHDPDFALRRPRRPPPPPPPRKKWPGRPSASARLVLDSFHNCVAGRGTPPLDRRWLLVAWAASPVRVFGGAVVRPARPLCGAF